MGHDFGNKISESVESFLLFAISAANSAESSVSVGYNLSFFVKSVILFFSVFSRRGVESWAVCVLCLYMFGLGG